MHALEERKRELARGAVHLKERGEHRPFLQCVRERHFLSVCALERNCRSWCSGRKRTHMLSSRRIAKEVLKTHSKILPYKDGMCGRTSGWSYRSETVCSPQRGAWRQRPQHATPLRNQRSRISLVRGRVDGTSGCCGSCGQHNPSAGTGPGCKAW